MECWQSKERAEGVIGANKTKMLRVLNGNETLQVERSSSDPSKRTINIKGEELLKNLAGFDQAFNDFLPRFKYIHTKPFHFGGLSRFYNVRRIL